MTWVVYGLNQTRITLYAADGTTPLYRITLQKEQREGLKLSFPPEGVPHDLGSGAQWAKQWTHRGFRPRLDISWDRGVESIRETWTSGAWGPPVTILTVTALSLIFTYAFQAPCLVEPHLDKAYSFSAQPDPTKALELQDLKRVVHTSLALSLIATIPGPIPDWASL
ncbi:hypothetical protein [Geothrix sp. 21YS21S-2]|uniref:hypothetical protein n=1 Tax=Geothrix sp. 21YS21S-2 TaxID=3068893 RepID=UPI0027B88B13|nr:hypothetical protein [Geothrix sp. 21YS21S-2]